MVPFITACHCWYDVPFLKCCVTFTADVMGHTTSEKLNFCLVSQSIFPKVFVIIKMSSAKTETSLHVPFFSSGFRFGTLPCRQFLSVLFLVVETGTMMLIDARPAVFWMLFCGLL